MSSDQALELFANLLGVAMFVAGPVLVASLLAGLLVGILQAAQATNQLLALQSRQSIQEQQLRLTQDRGAALEQARAVVAEARSREVRRRFVGIGTQYTPQPINFYGF